VKVGQEPEGTGGQFGWRVIIARINETSMFEFSSFHSKLLSLLLLTFFYLLIFSFFKLLISRKEIHLNFDNKTLPIEDFLVLSLVFIACFFAGTNYDFRLYFGVMAGIVLLSFVEFSIRVRSFFTTLFLLISWLSFESGGLEIFGDVLISLMIVIYLEIWRLLIFQKKFLVLPFKQF